MALTGNITPYTITTEVIDEFNALADDVRELMQEAITMEPTDEQAQTVITQWLNDHPEATTTVQDGSITDAKLVQTGGVLSGLQDLESRVNTILYDEYTGPTLSNFTSGASVTTNQWRCSGDLTQNYGTLRSISVQAATAGDAQIAIFELLGNTAEVIALFDVTCEQGLNEFKNGTDFNFSDTIPVNCFVGVAKASDSSFKPTFYADGTLGYNLTNFSASVGAVCSVLVTSNYNIGIGLTLLVNDLQIAVDSLTNSAIGHEVPYYQTRLDSLTNNSTMRITDACSAIKKGVVLSFIADITAFDFIRVRYSNSSLTTTYDGITIDSTNVTVSNNFNSSVAVYAHGLTITNNIAVTITSHYDETADITIMSNGETFTQSNISWFRMTANTMPTVVAPPGTTLTDLTLTQTCEDYRKKTWAYGDSYFNCDVTRWMYYVDHFGYMENMLVNAYPGENSANALIGLASDLQKGTPHYLLWALGMNDGSDSSSEPQEDWLSAIQSVITICESKGIIPILATVPTVPTINNEQKNAWVRSSGYQYIDFAKAVGADSNGNWFSGMLETDANPNIHPSAAGAQALFMRACADFPQMMIK